MFTHSSCKLYARHHAGGLGRIQSWGKFFLSLGSFQSVRDKSSRSYHIDENTTELLFKIIGNLDEGKRKSLKKDIYERIVSKNSCWNTEHIQRPASTEGN